jgi:serine/threonine protein kinase
MTSVRVAPALERLLDAPDAERQIGPYRLVKPIGSGGFAPVWIAKEVYDGVELRTVAVKLFALEGSAPERGSRAQRDRILDEARALCRVEHPNIVRFYAIATDPDETVLGLVMEHVQGRSLGSRLEDEKTLSPVLATEMGAVIAGALGAAHEAGVVHRDVKPHNVVEAGGAYKLIDFGIAAAEGAPISEHAEALSLPGRIFIDDLPVELGGTKLTEHGEHVHGNDDPAGPVRIMTSGTLGYIDPASIGALATPASDLYSLGAMLYECLTGYVPAVAAGRRDPVRRMKGDVLDGRVRPPSVKEMAKAVHPELAALVDTLLDPDPARRPSSAAAVARELQRIRGLLAIEEKQPAADAPAPDSLDLDEIARQAVARKRLTRLLLVLVPLCAVAVTAGVWRYRAWLAERAVRDAWQAAASCLLDGSVPQGESAGLRARRMQLAMLGRPSNADVEWPRLCAPLFDRLHQTLLQRADAHEPLTPAVERFVSWLANVDYDSNMSEPIEELVTAARERGLGIADLPTPSEKPPHPVDAPNIDDLPASARIADKPYAVERIQASAWRGPELHLLLHDPQLAREPILCTFAASPRTSRCRSLGGAVAGAAKLRLIGTAEVGARPLVAGGTAGEDGVFLGDDGAEIATMEVASAHVAKDGYVALVGPERSFETGEFEIVQIRGPGATPRRTLVEPKALGIPGIATSFALSGFLVLQSYDQKGEKKPHLYYRALPAEDPATGFTDAGELDWINAPVYACQSPEMVALRFGSNRGYLTFHDGRGFSAPLFVEDLGGAGLGCVGREVLVDDTPPQRCTKLGCEAWAIEAIPGAPWGGWRARTIVGQKQLAIRDRSGGAGVQYAVGASPWTRLLDDWVSDGTVVSQSTVTGLRLFGLGTAAVLLVGTRRGVYAIWLEDGAGPEPARIDAG